MKLFPGKMRNRIDLERRCKGTVYSVTVITGSEEHGVHALYIRQNCRRGDWSQETHNGWRDRSLRDGEPPTTVYSFADQADAAIFRMRFG